MIEYITDFAIIYLTYNAILGVIFVKKGAAKNIHVEGFFQLLVFTALIIIALPWFIAREDDGQT